MKILFDKWYWQKRKVREAVNRWILRRGFAKELPTLEQIADDIGVPAELLSIYIRTRTRKSVLSWRKELRIREARRLLLRFPDLPVSVIGEMAGIGDKSNFKRQFCQATGMTPRRWREKHLN